MVAELTRDYEVVMVLSPEATEDEVSATMDQVDGMIAEGGGSATEHEVWGSRRLAFKIKNFQEGNYVLTKFTSGPAALGELNRRLNALEDVLRFLVTKT